MVLNLSEPGLLPNLSDHSVDPRPDAREIPDLTACPHSRLDVADASVGSCTCGYREDNDSRTTAIKCQSLGVD